MDDIDRILGPDWGVGGPKPPEIVTLRAEIERLRADGSFLLDRLEDFERGIQDDGLAREWSGHVMPAIARFRAALSAGKRK